MKMRNEYTCPLELTHDAIRGKWKPIILWQLSKSPQSLSFLRHSIAGLKYFPATVCEIIFHL